MESYDVETIAFERREFDLRELEDIIARQRFGMADHIDEQTLTRFASENFQMTPLARSVSMEVAPILLLLGKVALGGALLTLLTMGIRRLLGMGEKMSTGGGRMAKIWDEYTQLEADLKGKVTDDELKRLSDEGLDALRNAKSKGDQADSAAMTFIKLLAGPDFDSLDQQKVSEAIKKLSSGATMTTMLQVMYHLTPEKGHARQLFNEFTVHGPDVKTLGALSVSPQIFDSCLNYLDHCEKTIFKDQSKAIDPKDSQYIANHPLKPTFDKNSDADQLMKRLTDQALAPIEMNGPEFAAVVSYIKKVNDPSGFYQTHLKVVEKLKAANLEERMTGLAAEFKKSFDPKANSQSATQPHATYAQAANQFGSHVSAMKNFMVPYEKLLFSYCRGAEMWVLLADRATKALKALREFVKAKKGAGATSSKPASNSQSAKTAKTPGTAVSTASWDYSAEDFDGVNESGGFDLDDAADDSLPAMIESQDIFKQVDETGDAFAFYDQISDAMVRGPIISEETFSYFQNQAARRGFEMTPVHRRTLLSRAIATESLGLGMILGGIGLVAALSGLAYYLWKKFSDKKDDGGAAESMSSSITKSEKERDKIVEEIAKEREKGRDLVSFDKFRSALKSGMTDDDDAKQQAKQQEKAYTETVELVSALGGEGALEEPVLQAIYNAVTQDTKKSSMGELIIHLASLSDSTAGHLSWATSAMVNRYGDEVFKDASLIKIATTFTQATEAVLKSTQICRRVVSELGKLTPQQLKDNPDSEWKTIEGMLKSIVPDVENADPEAVSVLSPDAQRAVLDVVKMIGYEGDTLKTKEDFDKAKTKIEEAGRPVPQSELSPQNVTAFIDFLKKPERIRRALYIRVGDNADRIAEELNRDQKQFEESSEAVKNKLQEWSKNSEYAGIKSQLEHASKLIAAYSHSARDYTAIMSAWMTMVRKLSMGTVKGAEQITKLQASVSQALLHASGGGSTPTTSTESYSGESHFSALPLLRGFNLEAFNQVDFTTIPDSEYPEYMEALDEEVKLMNSDAVHVQELHDYLHRHGLVEQQNIVDLERYFPGIVTNRMPLAAFTQFPSRTNYQLALEESGVAATAAKGAAVVAIAAIAVKMTMWLIQRFQMSRNAAMAIGAAGDDIRSRLEKLKDIRGTFVVRFNALSEPARAELASKINEYITKAGGTFSADQYGDGDAVATELVKAAIQAALKPHYNGLVADLTHEGQPLNKCLNPLTDVIVKNVAALTNNARKTMNDAKGANPPPLNASIIPDWHLQPLVSAISAKSNTPEALATEMKGLVDVAKQETNNPTPTLESLDIDEIGKMFESAVKLAKATTPDVDKRMKELADSMAQLEKANSSNMGGQSESVKKALTVVKADMKIVTEFQAIHTGILSTTKTFMDDLVKGLKSVEKAFSMTVKDKPKKEGDA